MKNLIRLILTKLHIFNLAKFILDNFRHSANKLRWHINRRFGLVDQAIINNYIKNNKTKKLHIGCGLNPKKGWLNSDLFPESRELLHLDATKPFPFKDNTFDYIFSEHMIEHVTYEKGHEMLKECYRTLVKDGKLRISTPDLQFLIDLYSENKSTLQSNYITWSTDNFIENAPYYSDTFVINNYVRDWGHLFIYDEKTLKKALEAIGFKKVVKCDLNSSIDKALQSLENDGRMPEGFLELESICLEATK